MKPETQRQSKAHTFFIDWSKFYKVCNRKAHRNSMRFYKRMFRRNRRRVWKIEVSKFDIEAD